MPSPMNPLQPFAQDQAHALVSAGQKAAGVAFAAAVAWWGSVPAIVQTLLLFMAADVVIGVLRAWGDRRFSLDKSWQGAKKKAAALVFVVLAFRLQAAHAGGADSAIPLAQGVAAFFIWHFGLSIARNAVLMGLPVPPVFRAALDAMNRQGGGTEDSQKDEGGQAGGAGRAPRRGRARNKPAGAGGDAASGGNVNEVGLTGTFTPVGRAAEDARIAAALEEARRAADKAEERG